MKVLIVAIFALVAAAAHATDSHKPENGDACYKDCVAECTTGRMIDVPCIIECVEDKCKPEFKPKAE